MQAQRARKAERWRRIRAGFAAMAHESEAERAAKRQPYKLECRPTGYGGTTCRENGDLSRHIECHTDGYGNTTCEEKSY